MFWRIRQLVRISLQHFLKKKMIVWLQIISLLAQKQLLFLVFMTSWNVALDLTLTLLFDARILIKLGSSSVASFLLTANILDLLNWFPILANELMCTVNGFIVTSYPKCPEWVFDINQILWYSESFNIVRVAKWLYVVYLNAICTYIHDQRSCTTYIQKLQVLV